MMLRDWITSLLGAGQSHWVIGLTALGLITGLFLLRYFIFAGAAYSLVQLLKRRAPWRRLQSTPFTAKQLRREIGYSISAAVIFALAILLIIAAAQAGLTRIYTDVNAYPIWWFWASIPAMLLLHDFYFYWAHRAMHLPGLYARVHKVHHRSTNPSPFAAFAFHPLETLIEVAIAFIIVFLIPLHPQAIFAFAALSIAYNVYGHLGYEVMPRALAKAPLIGPLLNKSAYHNQHHRVFSANYGLYTTIWDRLFGTMHQDADRLFDRSTRRPKRS